ncbi:MAG: hypothetical protein HC906_16740 [Bacteroidales bacterium]|nr:hypothetical protein [Bacteroidales bacterium]
MYRLKNVESGRFEMEVKTGLLNPVYKSKKNPEFGYYEYLPANYSNSELLYPMIIFLHGAGEVGNSRGNPEILKRILKHGIPFLISKNMWKPSYPFIVISPQNEEYGWDSERLRRFFEFLLENYQIEAKRVYMTGISMGGFGVFSFLGNMVEIVELPLLCRFVEEVI